MNGDFQDLLRKRAIKHETSCPNSPHQNGTAERYWRTLFEMARCLLLESGVPKMLWPYAVQTGAHIRTTQESLYLMQLLNSMDSKIYTCTRIYEDNQGAIALSKNPVRRQRCKHIDIKYHFLREVLISGKIDIVYCQTEHMLADILT
jgi:transposase InsO family protein